MSQKYIILYISLVLFAWLSKAETTSDCLACFHGQCLNQICVCNQGYTGVDCSLAINITISTVIPSYDCTNQCKNGYCDTGYCQCSKGFNGDRCENSVGNIYTNTTLSQDASIGFNFTNVLITSKPYSIRESDSNNNTVTYTLLEGSLFQRNNNQYLYRIGGASLQINYVDSKNGTYTLGNQNIPVEYGNVIAEITVSNWTFQSSLNYLQVEFYTEWDKIASAPCGLIDTTVVSDIPTELPPYLYLSNIFGSLFTQYINFIILDVRVAYADIESYQANSSSIYQRINLPYFDDSVSHVVLYKAYNSLSNNSCESNTTSTTGFPTSTSTTSDTSTTGTSDSSNLKSKSIVMISIFVLLTLIATQL
ncbi:hypothetical protein PPL_08639 [Heterostelium album PN500]|uniref:EGF-like domain-containing protein n=1 Tax=Heterostelium pallidum (strain ATCC 26659 / Pp 5 / PN500) TaxID=670386 RepID=D3BJB4_HETP5|nr:hypothetical protein PPL_08639 [Heterostelium album PN500]EFA77994.1 hypothetical protein PPL_08639 [Heterostelium album PN500]|eukprot:XP_020430122.1 hypothetical protein PPL_08639 [Heterostelium album PN500]